MAQLRLRAATPANTSATALAPDKAAGPRRSVEHPVGRMEVFRRHLGRRLGAALLLGLGMLALASDAVAQSRPDQVYVNTKGNVAPVSGKLLRNDIDKVVIEQGGREREFETSRVVRVVLGRVPATYTEAAAMLARGEAVDAARGFAQAASDSSASDVVRASARLRAAEALFAAGAKDAGQLAEAADGARRFLDDYPQNREVPNARLLEARAKRLAGDAKGALVLFRSLHGEASGSTTSAGYDPVLVYTAGLEGAHAALEASDVAAARELFGALEQQLAGALATAETGSELARDLTSLQVSTQLGEGYILLSEGRAPQALAFFRGQHSSAGESDTMRHRAGLGLGLALFATNDLRAAQLEFARYAAIGIDDPEGHARALLGAAQTALGLGDTEGREQARAWLTAVVESPRPSIASQKAQDLLRSL